MNLLLSMLISIQIVLLFVHMHAGLRSKMWIVMLYFVLYYNTLLCVLKVIKLVVPSFQKEQYRILFSFIIYDHGFSFQIHFFYCSSLYHKCCKTESWNDLASVLIYKGGCQNYALKHCPNQLVLLRIALLLG